MQLRSAAGILAISGLTISLSTLSFSFAQVAKPDGTIIPCTSSEIILGNGACGPIPSGGGSLPSGAIIISLTSPCPNGFTQETSLNGKFVLGTVAANADVGTTGGSDSITTILNHTHPVTDPGHAHGLAEGTTDGSGTFMDRSNAAAATTAVTDSATTGVTTANPAGGVVSIDNRPAFTRVIFCKAN